MKVKLLVVAARYETNGEAYSIRKERVKKNAIKELKIGMKEEMKK